ncbi:MAG: hypothetical protein IAI50_11145 [Candidatus Eremiobacteraeota bacterium]|nr:hypothetical protein [Candidatus Eremiobacteraeota bacterium]
MDQLRFPDGFVRREEPGCGTVDDVRFLNTLVRDADSTGNRRIPAGCNFLVRGWAYNPSPARLASAVLARIDDDLSIAVGYGRARPDIALHFSAPELEPCGFQAFYPLSDLELGPHSIKILTLDEAGGYYELPRAETFEIVPSRQIFPGIARAPQERMNISIDGFTALRSGAIPSGGTLLIERGDIVYLRGWAIDMENATSLGGVFAIVDDDNYVMGVHGLPREDVARSVRLPDVVRCGFSIRVATKSLRRGRHTIRVAALVADDSYGETLAGTIEIE